MFIIKIISIIFFPIPDSITMWVARLAGIFFYKIMKKGKFGLKTKRILPKVFPEKSSEWYDKVLKGNALHLMKFAGEMFKAHYKKNFFLKKKCYIASGNEYYRELFNHSDGFMILTCHLGNWEYAAAYLAIERKIYAPVFVENSTGNRALNWIRTGHNVELIPVGRDPKLSAKSLLYMMSLLRNGEIVFIVADQAPQGGDLKAWFFGKLLRIFGGPYIIGEKTKKPAIPMYSLRDGRNNIAIYFDKPVYFGNDNDINSPLYYSFTSIEEGAQHIMKFFESAISKYPHQYLWSQDRW